VQVGEDPFTKLKAEKQERVKAQHNRQLANIKASAKSAGSSAALPPTLKLAAVLPEHGKGRPAKRKEMQEDVSCLFMLASLEQPWDTSANIEYDSKN
jgi:regulator of ribosome biosynthesis